MVENISDEYIIDSSYLLAYLFPDESSRDVDKTFMQYKNSEIHLIAPKLLRYEVIAGLWSAIMRKRVSGVVARALAERFLDLDITYSDVMYTDVLDLAVRTGLTVYDASYLWLSREKQTPLLTLDKQLRRVAKSHLKV